MHRETNKILIMQNQNFTPQESLALITEVIREARHRLEENGFIFVFWGALIALASFGQYVLLRQEQYAISWYPYLLMPAGALVTGIYYARRRKNTGTNQIARMVSVSWNTIAMNLIILGFVFGNILKEHLIPVILILLATGFWVSAAALRSKILYFSAIIINISAYICFYTDRLYQPLCMGMVSVVAILIPGIIWMIHNRRK